MSTNDDGHSKAAADAERTQDERLEQALDHAREDKAEADAKWEQGREEVAELEREPPASKEEFPKDGSGEFETFGSDEAPPPGSPEHDRGGSIDGP
jgi:hypothetical protein